MARDPQGRTRRPRPAEWFRPDGEQPARLDQDQTTRGDRRFGVPEDGVRPDGRSRHVHVWRANRASSSYPASSGRNKRTGPSPVLAWLPANLQVLSDQVFQTWSSNAMSVHFVRANEKNSYSGF